MYIISINVYYFHPQLHTHTHTHTQQGCTGVPREHSLGEPPQSCRGWGRRGTSGTPQTLCTHSPQAHGWSSAPDRQDKSPEATGTWCSVFHLYRFASFVPSLFQLWGSRESLHIPASRMGRRLVGWDEHLSPLARAHNLPACLNHFETSIFNDPGLFTCKGKSLAEMSPNSSPVSRPRVGIFTDSTCLRPQPKQFGHQEHLQGLHHPTCAANTQRPAQSPALLWHQQIQQWERHGAHSP